MLELITTQGSRLNSLFELAFLNFPPASLMFNKDGVYIKGERQLTFDVFLPKESFESFIYTFNEPMTKIVQENLFSGTVKLMKKNNVVLRINDSEPNIIEVKITSDKVPDGTFTSKIVVEEGQNISRKNQCEYLKPPIVINSQKFSDIWKVIKSYVGSVIIEKQHSQIKFLCKTENISEESFTFGVENLKDHELHSVEYNTSLFNGLQKLSSFAQGKGSISLYLEKDLPFCIKASSLIGDLNVYFTLNDI